MGKNNRTCYTCGKKYSYCFSCPDDPRPRWSYMFDCEECKDIFEIVTSYGTGSYSAQETYEKLQKYNLEDKDFSTYSYGVQKLMKQLFEELNSVETTEITQEEVCENAAEAETKYEVVNTPKATSKPKSNNYNNNKRKHKHNKK